MPALHSAQTVPVGSLAVCAMTPHRSATAMASRRSPADEEKGSDRRIQLFSATLSNLTNLRDQEVCHGDVADSVHGSAEGRAMGAMEERAKYCGNLSGAGKEEQDRR